MEISKKEAGTMKRKMTLLAAILAILFVFVQPQYAQAADANDLKTLIAQLPEVSDPTGTQYYFYNQLTDLEKVMYWKMSEATWSNPTITISGLSGYTEAQLHAFAARAYAALLTDNPRARLMWTRYGMNVISYDNSVLKFSMNIEYNLSAYQIRKAEARIRQIAATVGSEGDLYSRTRDLLEVMYQEMDYDPYHPFQSNRKNCYNDTAVGCLLYGRAVCAGFADTFKILCDELRIPCIIVGNAGHAWNYVKMDDGKWYAVDTTVDVPFDWNCQIIGAQSEQYVGNGNYFTSDLYIAKEGDFAFPTLSPNAYSYSGKYVQSLHNASLSFSEPSPTFRYQVNRDGKTCTVIGYEGQQKGDLKIPSQIDGFTVTKVADAAFYRNTGFTGNLVIPDTVLEIGPCAFQACTGLKGNLVLSQKLKSIDEHAFLGNTTMKGTLDFPESLANIGRCAFYECEGLTGDLVLPEGIALGDEIFYACKGLTGTLYIPDSMTWNGNITTGSGISKISVKQTNTQYAAYDGMLFSKDMKTLLACPGGKTGNMTIPEGVETIARIAAYNCNNLNGTLKLPNSLKTIEEFAFYGTSFTGDLIIPDSVQVIGESAFCGGKFDGRLELSDSLTRIESFTFFGCQFAGDLNIPKSVTHIGEFAFFGVNFDGEIHMPESIAYIGRDAIGGSYTNSLELMGPNTVLEKDAFLGSCFSYFACNCGSGYETSLFEDFGVVCGVMYTCRNCLGTYISPANGWHQQGKLWYYYKDTVKQTGWQQIGGYWYYLGSDGAMRTGWVGIGGKWYYMNQNGVMMTGWVKDGGNWYYMNKSGVMQTGWQTINGYKYYFASNGKMATGATKIGSTTYLFNSGGTLGKGWVQVGSKWYYANSSGVAQTGWVSAGGKWYYMDANGIMQTGLKQIGGKYYYFTSGGVMTTGWQNVNGVRHLFNSKGAAVSGWYTENGRWYFLKANGAVTTGWMQNGGYWYFMDKSTGVMKTGWVQDGSYWYYMNKSGVMQTGWVQDGNYWYYMNKSGVMQTGTQVINGKTYKFNSSGVWIG